MFHLRDRELARKIVDNLKKLRLNVRFLHVCGTHQDTLVRHGLDDLFKECGIDIRQGPGCPVCVTTPREIEEAIVLARKNKIVASFGDMLEVPGEKQSLQGIKADGYDVRTVYGIEDAVDMARENKESEVVFMAIGFETTAPTTASVLLSNPPPNFSILSCHRLIPPALKTILDMGEIRIDGLIDPGHVSAVIGTKPYEFVSKNYSVPQVIAGFEPIDLLMSAWMLTRQIQQGKAVVENEYTRVVKEEGNTKALEAINNVFETSDMQWRGFHIIPKSGMQLRKKFVEYDARRKYEDELQEICDKEFAEPKGCRCGEVLRGLVTSQECPLFGKTCTPNTPIGPCMVSKEGSCNIEFRYSKK